MVGTKQLVLAAMTDVIATDQAFSEAQQRGLAMLAELMIPGEGELPSAADAEILADIFATLRDQSELVAEAMTWLASLGADTDAEGAGLLSLSAEEQQQLIAQLRQACPAFVARFEGAVAACYYRDARVLSAIGLPGRAPYPEGNAVAATDWSLLDPVRERSPFYREV